ncbi:hypothetical protein EB118_01585 [bacterium]|nr:hypothetical protein [bacterium]NBX98529.1 hypothetical protein [bacterium]NDC93835.1 hypothetical protein [bacterium]NDD84208.1 hypothetical protein [bacterium]NDG28781.1 hypothetical protein [bacterium]
MNFEYQSLSDLKRNYREGDGPPVELDAILRSCEVDELTIESSKSYIEKSNYDLVIARRVGESAIAGYQLFDYDPYEIDVYMGHSRFNEGITEEEKKVMEYKFKDIAISKHFG